MRRLFLQMSDRGLSAFRLSPSPRDPEGADVRARLGGQSRHSAQSRPSDRISLRIQQKIPLRKRIFPLQALPDALPEKHSPLRTGFRREKRIKTLPFSRILPQRCYFQHRSLHTPRRSPRLSVAFRKQYIRTEEQNQEKKKARPDRTGSGKLTSLRRFLCLCKRWNRLISLLWRESDWSCSG